MTEGRAAANREAGAMPSWSASDPPSDRTVTLPAGATAAAIERVRRLLEQLFSGRPHDDDPAPPKQ